MSRAIRNEKKKRSSPDYPLLARNLLKALAETSLDAGVSKLPAGLYIIATPIGNLGDITFRALVTLQQADCVACEDTRISGSMLAKFGLKKTLISYHDHNDDQRRPDILKRIASGDAVAMISDAGMPLIADPGYKLVHACRTEGHDVIVIPGANAAVTALVGSGLAAHAFHFSGFLPAKKTARRKSLANLKMLSTTLIFYEAPQRLAETLDDFVDCFGPTRLAAVARELTKVFEDTRRGSLQDLAAFYRTNTARGEIVIIVGPAQDGEGDAYDLNALLKSALQTESLRDAVVAVSEITGIKKSDVYKHALKMVRNPP
jgi:16S rRNA (cytidine1402-2'-O)-methyltransferase